MVGIMINGWKDEACRCAFARALSSSRSTRSKCQHLSQSPPLVQPFCALHTHGDEVVGMLGPLYRASGSPIHHCKTARHSPLVCQRRIPKFVMCVQGARGSPRGRQPAKRFAGRPRPAMLLAGWNPPGLPWTLLGSSWGQLGRAWCRLGDVLSLIGAMGVLVAS